MKNKLFFHFMNVCLLLSKTEGLLVWVKTDLQAIAATVTKTVPLSQSDTKLAEHYNSQKEKCSSQRFGDFEVGFA